MPGRFCNGVATFNQYPLIESRAFCEGLHYRASDTVLSVPKTDNPHASGSDAATSWDAGWDVADAAAGGNISKADAPCCALPEGTVPA